MTLIPMICSYDLRNTVLDHLKVFASYGKARNHLLIYANQLDENRGFAGSRGNPNMVNGLDLKNE